MRNSENKTTDLETAKERIMSICREFNVAIKTDDWHGCWLRDKDSDETTGLGRM